MATLERAHASSCIGGGMKSLGIAVLFSLLIFGGADLALGHSTAFFSREYAAQAWVYFTSLIYASFMRRKP